MPLESSKILQWRPGPVLAELLPKDPQLPFVPRALDVSHIEDVQPRLGIIVLLLHGLERLFGRTFFLEQCMRVAVFADTQEARQRDDREQTGYGRGQGGRQLRLALAPSPRSFKRANRSRGNRLAREEPAQVFSQASRGVIALARILFQALEANGVEVAGNRTHSVASGGRARR